jgi:hypothetical protein
VLANLREINYFFISLILLNALTIFSIDYPLFHPTADIIAIAAYSLTALLILISRRVMDKRLFFAGAMRSMYLMEHGELIEIQGDKISIEAKENLHQIQFREHIYHAEDLDALILFSDGVVAQFGGTNVAGKKLKVSRFKEYLVELFDASDCKTAGSEPEARLKRWQGNFEQTDDISFLALRF